MNTQTDPKNVNSISILIGVLLAGTLSGVMIWLVGWLGLGLTVDSLAAAFIAGYAIAVVGGLITWLLSLGDFRINNELLLLVVNILVGALVLYICGRFLEGLSVEGFAGALLASLAIAVISWLLSIPLKRINQ